MKTRSFSLDRVESVPPWLRSITENTGSVPEADCGVSHFVYRSRRAFHPGRLHGFFQKHFILREHVWSRPLEDATCCEENREADHQCPLIHAPDDRKVDSGVSRTGNTQFKEVAERVAQAAEAVVNFLRNQDGVTSPVAVAACAANAAAATAALAASVVYDLSGKQVGGSSDLGMHGRPGWDPGYQEAGPASRRHSDCELGLLVRSKGLAWLATRQDHRAEWNHAGTMMRFSTGTFLIFLLGDVCRFVSITVDQCSAWSVVFGAKNIKVG